MSLAPADEITASCVLEGGETIPPVQLCALFLARLAEAHPERTVIEPAQGEEAELTLVVSKVSRSSLVARIDQPGRPGEPLGTARADADLDDAAVARFLDRLISAALLQ